ARITSRVAGVVEKIRFKEGDTVSSGVVLAEIEPARYQIAQSLTEAEVKRDEVAKRDAEQGLARRLQLSIASPGAIAAEELTTWQTKVDLATAELAQSTANLDQAKLNYQDSVIRSTQSGIIQTRSVQSGQYIQIGTELATLINR